MHCAQPEEWSEHMRDEVVTYMTAHADLGESMLEIGPGAGHLRSGSAMR